MTTHAFLLRAINVGGTAKLPMAELRALATELGATEVATYIASGNLLATPPGPPTEFASALSAAIEQRYGFEREVIVRDRAALRAALAEHPFKVTDAARSFIAPLTATPEAAALEAAGAVPRGADVWRLIGDDLHIRYELGAGRSELDLARLLRALGVAGTARNLRTIETLIGLLQPGER